MVRAWNMRSKPIQAAKIFEYTRNSNHDLLPALFDINGCAQRACALCNYVQAKSEQFFEPGASVYLPQHF
jgi:hypothetical protein